eukprot:SAG31_NODE_4966_length_2829_cov_4.529304_5_plen_47_part_00
MLALTFGWIFAYIVVVDELAKAPATAETPTNQAECGPKLATSQKKK